MLSYVIGTEVGTAVGYKTAGDALPGVEPGDATDGNTDFLVLEDWADRIDRQSSAARPDCNFGTALCMADEVASAESTRTKDGVVVHRP